MNGFDDLLVLLRLLGDPAAYEARLKELRSTIAAADEATAETQVERAALAAERSKLDAMSADLRKREAQVVLTAKQNEQDIAAIAVWRRRQRVERLVVHGNGLTSEPDLTANEPDPHFDSTADHDATASERPYDPMLAREIMPAGVTLTRNQKPRRGAASH